MKGRIGDAPLVGCGGYANEYGAATSSGYGEVLMKMTLARDVVYNIENGKSAMVKFYYLFSLSHSLFTLNSFPPPVILNNQQKIYGAIYKTSGKILGRFSSNISLNFF